MQRRRRAAHLETMRVQDDMPISCLSQQVTLSLASGQGYRFVNLFHAEPGDRPRELTIRQVDDGLAVVRRAAGCDVVALRPAVDKLPGLQAAAELVLLAPDRLAVAGCTSLGAGPVLLDASAPVSLEVAPSAGTATVVTDGQTRLTLRLKPGVGVVGRGGQKQQTDRAGRVTFTLPAGRHRLKFDPFPMYAEVLAACANVERRPAVAANRADDTLQVPPLKPAWRYDGLEPTVARLPVKSVRCAEPYEGRYGPVEKLFDGRWDDSFTSVQWPRRVRPTVTAELSEPAHSQRRAARVAQRPGPRHRHAARSRSAATDSIGIAAWCLVSLFRPTAGTSDSYANTAEEIQVGQDARQVRLTITPAGKNDSVLSGRDRDSRHTAGHAAGDHGLRTGRSRQRRPRCAGRGHGQW